ncbi:MAG: type II secretion system protein [Planctomycetes bacterium]|nr:type II secretion system protein [Planctomycetota bacterium]
MKPLSLEDRAINQSRNNPDKTAGYTLLETIVVLTILMIIITLVSMDVFGRIKQWRINEDASRFAQMLHLGAEHSVYTNRTHVAVIRVSDGSYTIYPTNENKEFQRGVRPLIPREYLKYCEFDVVKFEDGSSQFSGEVLIYISPKGWQASVLFEMSDRNDETRRRFVRCDRFTTRVRYNNQPLELIEARANLTMYSSL